MLEYIQSHLVLVISLLAGVMHVAGIGSTIHALLNSPTSQGAIAWAMALVTFPYVALPAYWILGRNKFLGYVDARRQGDDEIHHVTQTLRQYRPEFQATLEGDSARFAVLERLAKMPFTGFNEVELLVDGDATFSAIFEAIDSAQDYVLVQFFIIRDDRLGRELKNRLCRKAREGIRVYLLYDEIGSHSLSKAYIQDLREVGVDVRPFWTTKGWRNRLQVNFRNHRKIVVVDGRVAFVGGFNVGDEYMGRDPRVGPWRDTHARFEGPSVTCVQLGFLEDWHWASHEVPQLEWRPMPSQNGQKKVLVLPTGPADALETCNLFFLHAIHSARRRIWIVSPYFVPDHDILAAIQLAALRGVDVRILLPLKPDHKIVYLASFSYLSHLAMDGVRIFRYEPGFLHQKVLLVDDDLASVGTANADNRSFRLNFEISMVVADRGFASEVECMLERDFAQCRLVTEEDYERRGFVFKLGVKVARLFSPIL